ncbi:MAG: YjgP/YjgQ family permease, partial [Bacteroidetes bacterium]
MVGNFLPPFGVAFAIALFVFVLQTLWLYIDDIAGKGVGFFLLVELVSYLSVSMVPMSLSVAVLLTSVMVLGNMAERYELSSFKSAGVSLWRVMRPLIVLTAGIALFSYFCLNNLIPVSNLKFKSRLYDIRKQKPTLTLDEGVFNDDFKGYAIRIGKKLPDNRHIEDVLIYDHSEAEKGRYLAVAAKSGEMYVTQDGSFFVMELHDGQQYMEPKPSTKEKGGRTLPFVRTSFRTWYKVFDLDEFELNRTDEQLFKNHYSMLNSRQLRQAIDSIDASIQKRLDNLGRNTTRLFHPRQQALRQQQRELQKDTLSTPRKVAVTAPQP